MSFRFCVILLLTGCLFVITNVGKAVEPPITTLAFSPDGNSLIAGSQRGIEVFRWPAMTSAAKYRCESPNVHCMAFSPSGDFVAVGGGVPADEGTVEMLKWPELRPAKTLRRHTDSVMDVAWLNEREIASAGLDHEVVIWDSETGRPKHIMKGHSRGVTSLTAIPGTNVLVSAGIDQSLRVWDTASGNLLRSMVIHTLPVHDLAFRPATDGLPMVASASEDRSIRFWQPTIGRMVRFARLSAKPLAIDWTPDGKKVVAACADGKLRFVDPNTVSVTNSDVTVSDWAYSVVTQVDGAIVVGSADAQISVTHATP